MRLGAFLAALLADLFRLMGQLGAPGRVLGVPWGAHGDLLGSSLGSPGRLGVLLELLGCGLGVAWGRHGVPFGMLWAACGLPRRNLQYTSCLQTCMNAHVAQYRRLESYKLRSDC